MNCNVEILSLKNFLGGGSENDCCSIDESFDIIASPEANDEDEVRCEQSLSFAFWKVWQVSCQDRLVS